MKNITLRSWLDDERHLAYVILIPAVTLILAFGHIPALSSLRLAFMKYNIKMPNKIQYIGLENFAFVLRDPEFHASLLRVLFFLVWSLLSIMVISLIFSLLLNQEFKGRSIVRTIVIIPWAIPPVVSGHMWKWIFNGEFGVFNGVLLRLGIIDEYQFWLTDQIPALLIASLIFVWRFVPFVTILFLGALQAIPKSIYESASVDGAGVIRRFTAITLPSLMTIGAIAIVLAAIAGFNVFDEIFALMGSQELTQTPMIYNYETTFIMGRFGRGAAMAYLTGIILFCFSFIYMRLSLKEQDV